MFEKKFSLRVKHFLRQNYCIEYSEHRFRPNWHILNQWLYLEGTPSFERQDWNPILLPYEEAIQFAQQFKSMTDIEEHYQKQEIIRVNQLKLHADWRAKNLPVDIVTIL